ncbi:MFS transporter [Rhizohabitans arisaemae]|uniref:MFS transporter n=1 Tax=Rhizohabitans arisaemae TaxID=2720610 RepID=UPI0024B20D27|nr:MFS transporter [Rhizohabitans arisaemae]
MADGGEGTRHGVWVTIGALMLALLLAALDQTIVSTALPTIVGEFGGVDHLSWVVTAYLLTATVSTPLWGKLGDQFGRKGLFQSSVVVFLIGSALCGLSQDMAQLIGFRALQGLGGGGLIVLTQAIVGDVVPPRDRGRYQGVFGAVFGVSSVIGPLIGGLLTDQLSWRWVFYVNLPIGVVALAAIGSTLRARPEKTRHTIDYLGTALLAGAVVCLILVTSWGGTVFAWNSPEIIGLGAGAIALLALWWRAERRAAEPVIPLRLFTVPAFSVTAVLAFITGFAMFGALTYLPLYLQVVHGVSATVSGVYLLPMVAGMLLTSVGSGQAISRTGRYKVFPMTGMAVVAFAAYLLSRMDEHSSTLQMSVNLLVLGIGLGLVVQVLIIIVQNAVGYEDLGVATSSATFCRSIGGAFGVSVFGSLFAARLAENTRAALAGVPLPPGFDPASVQGSPQQLKTLPPDVAGPVIHAYSESVQSVFGYVVPVALLGFAAACFLTEVPLRTASRAQEPGESLVANPVERSSREEMESALTRLIAKDPRASRLYADLAGQAGFDFPAATAWVLCRVARQGRAGRAELAARAGVALDRCSPHADTLVKQGLITREGDDLIITEAGRRAAARLVDLRRRTLTRYLEGWSPEDHPELAELVGRLAAATVGDDHDARVLRAGDGTVTGRAAGPGASP